MANPPFTGSLDYEVVEKSLLTLAKSKKTELLFLAQFIRSLELGGRCASIVPDGVLFGTSNAHKAIRRELVENQTLQAVISMPSGVFKPYAGVPTAILIFTKTNAGGTIISRFHKLTKEKERTRKEQSFLVPKADIVANDYDLSINKYKEVERVKVVYDDPEVVLGRLENLQNQLAEAMVEYKTIVKKSSE